VGEVRLPQFTPTDFILGGETGQGDCPNAALNIKFSGHICMRNEVIDGEA
jgi:hypothetical protein